MSLLYPFAFRLHPSLCVGPLAQLVEQLTLNQRVRSSSLRRPTKSFLHAIRRRRDVLFMSGAR